MNRHILLWIFASLAAACTGTLSGDYGHTDSDRPPWVGLEGDALTRELETSPPRRAPIRFMRLGVSWDASSPAALEISTSPDGQVWSDWRAPRVVGHEVEGQADAAFVGDLDLEEPAEHYRVRAGVGRASFASLEFLEETFSDSIEDGAPPTEEDAAVDATAVAVGSRASWGARPAKCVSSHTPNRFTIHHTVTPTNDTLSPQARLRNIQAYHQDTRGWCDIGYNFLISRDGKVWEGRGATRVGSHVTSQNTGNLGISFIGTYTTTSATTTQINAAAGLVGDLARRYGIKASSTTVKGHRDRGTTSCPGDRLYGQIGSIINASQTASVDPPPADAATTVKGFVYAGADPTRRIAGASVTIAGRTVTTSAVGDFEVAGVTGAMFDIAAAAPGFLPVTVRRAPAGAETWASISLSAAVRNAGLQGVVYRGTDTTNRVAGAAITLSSGQRATTNESGYYRIDSLAPGPVTITAASGGRTITVTRTLVSDVRTWGSVGL